VGKRTKHLDTNTAVKTHLAWQRFPVVLCHVDDIVLINWP